jgi:hypothetical protein
VPPQLHRGVIQHLFRILSIAQPVPGEQKHPPIDDVKELDKRLFVALTDSTEQPNGKFVHLDHDESHRTPFPLVKDRAVSVQCSRIRAGFHERGTMG